MSALWFISTIERDVFRFNFRAFEVRETCRDAAGAASTLEMGHMDLSSSCVCVYGHGHARIILTEFTQAVCIGLGCGARLCQCEYW